MHLHLSQTEPEAGIRRLTFVVALHVVFHFSDVTATMIINVVRKLVLLEKQLSTMIHLSDLIYEQVHATTTTPLLLFSSWCARVFAYLDRTSM